MYRGTIEDVRPDFVSGWLFSEDVSLYNKLVLAFVDNACVGAGRIEVHRPDLEAAGLGDGRLGFAFPINVKDANEADRVAVKLDGSDAWLLQRDSRLVAKDARKANALTPEEQQALLASYKWMLSRGWLRQSDYDYLKTLLQFGIYERTLVGVADELSSDAARALAVEGLSLLAQANVDVVDHAIGSAQDYAAKVAELRGTPGRAAFGLWTAGEATLNIVEGSHLGGSDELDGLKGSIRVVLEPDRLVMVDAHCQSAIDAFPGAEGIHLFSRR